MHYYLGLFQLTPEIIQYDHPINAYYQCLKRKNILSSCLYIFMLTKIYDKYNARDFPRSLLPTYKLTSALKSDE